MEAPRTKLVAFLLESTGVRQQPAIHLGPGTMQRRLALVQQLILQRQKRFDALHVASVKAERQGPAVVAPVPAGPAEAGAEVCRRGKGGESVSNGLQLY